MKIGIFIRGQSELFNNGCNQQALFVYQSIKSIGYECFFFTANTDEKYFLDHKTYDISKNWNLLLSLNVFICLSNTFSQVEVAKNIRASGVKMVNYNCGNMYYMFMEDILFDCHNYVTDDIINRHSVYDQLWVIPNCTKDIHFYKSITRGTQIYTAPYVWNTDVVDMIIESKPNDLHYNTSNNGTKYILIAEGNVNIVKSSMIPLLICEELYNTYEDIRIIVLCKRETKGFKNFCNNLEIHKAGLVEYYPRISYLDTLYQLREKGLDVYVLSHHHDNPLNFLHLETLYLNYPLIHNSKWYSKAGYYYKDIQNGAKQLLHAFECHKNKIEAYKSNTERVLQMFSPYNSTNKTIYKRYLDEL